MLGMLAKPIAGKFSGSADSSYAATSPRSPLEMRTQSPRGLKNYDLDGVGLGIVAALEKSGGEFLGGKPLYNRNLNRSKPIPVNSGNKFGGYRGGFEMEMEDSSSSLEEEYTIVTCRGLDNKSYTRVYCNGAEHDTSRFERRSIKKKSSCNNRPALFDISPARFGGDFTEYPASDFLSSCHLCHKKLHGKDIYMYRGEKAFCSTECRYRQIVTDERKEKCRSGASRSVDVSTSPYTSEQIFSTGILAS